MRRLQRGPAERLPRRHGAAIVDRGARLALAGGDRLAYGRVGEAQRVGDGLDVVGEFSGALDADILEQCFDAVSQRGHDGQAARIGRACTKFPAGVRGYELLSIRDAGLSNLAGIRPSKARRRNRAGARLGRRGPALPSVK